jgi:hypothetical protein
MSVQVLPGASGPMTRRVQDAGGGGAAAAAAAVAVAAAAAAVGAHRARRDWTTFDTWFRATYDRSGHRPKKTLIVG